MSDVERICARNHSRARWADEYSEYADAEPAVEAPAKRTKRSRRCTRAAAAVSYMAHCIGLMIVGIGLAQAAPRVIIPGAAITVVCLLCTKLLDERW